MSKGLFTVWTIEILLIHWIFGGFVTISDTSGRVVKLGFLLEKNRDNEIKAAFDMLLDEMNENGAILPIVVIEGITIEWTTRDSPHSTLQKIQEEIIANNVSALLSFLPANENYIFVNALSKAVIPVIGLGSLAEESYSSSKEGAMYLSMLPTEDLQVRVIKDLMLEFEESRFACITTTSSKDDALLTHLSQHVQSSDGQQGAAPRCTVVGKNILDELNVALTAIKGNGVRLIVVHCDYDESTAMLEVARKLSLQELGDDFVWIFTDKAIGRDAGYFPEGSFGVQKVRNTGDDKRSTLYKQLLNDSLVLFARSLERALEELSPDTTLEYLEGERFYSLKKKLYRNMLRYTASGQTGTIQFSPSGERIAYKFTIVKVVRPPEGRHHWDVLGSACPEGAHAKSPAMFEAFLPRDLPEPRHLRIVTIEHEPFTMIHETECSSIMGKSCKSVNTVPCVKFNASDTSESPRKTGPWREHGGSYEIKCCFGVMIDILLKLQEIDKFTFDLYLVKDGKYGSLDPDTKEMNGMIGDVYRGFADLALAMITITEERSEFVDFTTPYIGTALAFLIKRFSSRDKTFVESISDMRLMTPFSMRLWFMCVAAFFTVAVTVWVMEKLYYYQNHKSSYLLPFEFVTYVFGNIFHVPLTTIQAKSHTVPFVMVVANFGGLVLVSSYTANLLASLITVEEVSIVSGITDNKLIDPPEGFSFATIKDTSTEDFFRNSPNTRLRKIYDNMKHNNVHDFYDGVKRVKSGELTAFLGEYDSLLHHVQVDSNCSLKLDGLPFDLSGLAFALTKHSQWNRLISRAIHELNARDTIPKIFQKWTVAGCQTSQQTVVPYRMGLSEFGGFLFNTAMIACGCFIILLAEILVYRRITRTRNSFTLAQNGFALAVLSLPESSSLTSIIGNDNTSVTNVQAQR